MLVFIDTEFTNFTDMEMISIGLVSADKSKEFYMENANYNRHACSPFVKEIVIPLLTVNLDVMQAKFKIEDALREWIESFNEPVEIVIDYLGDWEILIDLFGGLGSTSPTNMSKQPIFVQALVDFNEQAGAAYVKGCQQYFDETGQHPHHALSDAKSNLFGYHQAMKLLY
jgi:hypothetical protein